MFCVFRLLMCTLFMIIHTKLGYSVQLKCILLDIFDFVRTRNPRKNTMMALGISNIFFMLPWQFAQFVLLTQVSDGRDNKIINMLTHADV